MAGGRVHFQVAARLEAEGNVEAAQDQAVPGLCADERLRGQGPDGAEDAQEKRPGDCEDEDLPHPAAGTGLGQEVQEQDVRPERARLEEPQQAKTDGQEDGGDHVRATGARPAR